MYIQNDCMGTDSYSKSLETASREVLQSREDDGGQSCRQLAKVRLGSEELLDYKLAPFVAES